MEASLGDAYRDEVSGFTGVAIGRAVYLYEGPQVLLAAHTRQAPSDSRWFPESRCVAAEKGAAGFAVSSPPTESS